jgi:hypothetical protein
MKSIHHIILGMSINNVRASMLDRLGGHGFYDYNGKERMWVIVWRMVRGRVELNVNNVRASIRTKAKREIIDLI